MKITHLALLAVMAVAAHSASAQSSDPRSSSSSGMSSSSGSTGGSSVGGSAAGGSAAGDSGNISNLDSAAGGVGLAPGADGLDATGLDTAGDASLSPTSGEMADTGGEPPLMALAGIALASGGLLLRRKIA